VSIKISSARQGNVPIMIREMILVSKDKFPYDNWPSSRFRDEKNPITETTSTLSNRKQEKKTKKRKLPLMKKQQRS